MSDVTAVRGGCCGPAGPLLLPLSPRSYLGAVFIRLMLKQGNDLALTLDFCIAKTCAGSFCSRRRFVAHDRIAIASKVFFAAAGWARA